nr:immunoglobulin heavy chain junction region [Mus musculus]
CARHYDYYPMDFW